MVLFQPPSTSLTITSASQAAYRARRDYLNPLLSPTHPDLALAEVSAARRPELEVFMRGQTEYQDEAGRHMIYAHDLAAWASDLIYGAGLPAPLPLASLNVAELRAPNPAVSRIIGAVKGFQYFFDSTVLAYGCLPVPSLPSGFAT